jgi:predicted metalloprotease
MRWKDMRRSSKVDDRRGRRGGGLALGGGGAIIVVIVALLFGVDPRALLEQIPAGSVGMSTEAPVARSAQENELADFVSAVLAQTEDVWHEEFRSMGREYPEPTLVLFTDQVNSACGMAGAAAGPFYCPGDRQVYIDLGFYDLLRQRLGAPGDFAQAYVIAHEVGHHVQNVLGISDKLHQARGRVSEREYNALSVRLELQADFFAGLWAHHAQRMNQVIEPGDIDEALTAASAIGDDKLQMQSEGRVVPDAFTHGTSEQRMRWFMRGFETGDIRQGDTFAATRL